ncbi:MAG TPA: diaminopimelate epimerase [Gammaproteobacteria bacterium]|jgi:diaminopimelate epimerase|nr:diaminopimelate epimerase [Gammaproteobacteria bacterium]
MTLNFTKMHGLGNDFVVIDAINQAVTLTPGQVRALADRHFGIGCDQLLLVESATAADADFRYRIFNADGGEVGQCGNGARCFMQFVHEHGLTDKPSVKVETANGMLQLLREADGQITVNMGIPRFEPPEIPFSAAARAEHYTLDAGGHALEIGALSLGNPHAVLRVTDIETAPVAELGALIEHHERFPERVNAGFMQIVDDTTIRVRVYERGAGETLACGSGACAAVVAGRLWGQLNDTVKVMLKGGELVVSWSGEGTPVMMTGPATTVFQGQIDL